MSYFLQFFSQNVIYLSQLFLTDTKFMMHIFKIKTEELVKAMKVIEVMN